MDKVYYQQDRGRQKYPPVTPWLYPDTGRHEDGKEREDQEGETYFVFRSNNFPDRQQEREETDCQEYSQIDLLARSSGKRQKSLSIINYPRKRSPEVPFSLPEGIAPEPGKNIPTPEKKRNK